jgi:hypothetical protein
VRFDELHMQLPFRSLAQPVALLAEAVHSMLQTQANTSVAARHAATGNDDSTKPSSTPQTRKSTGAPRAAPLRLTSSLRPVPLPLFLALLAHRLV